MSKTVVTSQSLINDVVKQFEFDQTLSTRTPTQRFQGGIQQPGAFYQRLRNPISSTTTIVTGSKSTIITAQPTVEKTCHCCKQRRPEQQLLTCTSTVVPRRPSNKYDEYSIGKCDRVYCYQCLQRHNADAIPNEVYNFANTPCWHVATRPHFICPYCLDCCSCGDCVTKRDNRANFLTHDTPSSQNRGVELTYGLYTVKLLKFLKTLSLYGPAFFLTLNKDRNDPNSGMPNSNPSGINQQYSTIGWADLDYTDLSTPGLSNMIELPQCWIKPDGTKVEGRRLAPFFYGDRFGPKVEGIPAQSVYYQAMHEAVAYQDQLTPQQLQQQLQLQTHVQLQSQQSPPQFQPQNDMHNDQTVYHQDLIFAPPTDQPPTFQPVHHDYDAQPTFFPQGMNDNQ